MPPRLSHLLHRGRSGGGPGRCHLDLSVQRLRPLPRPQAPLAGFVSGGASFCRHPQCKLAAVYHRLLLLVPLRLRHPTSPLALQPPPASVGVSGLQLLAQLPAVWRWWRQWQEGAPQHLPQESWLKGHPLAPAHNHPQHHCRHAASDFGVHGLPFSDLHRPRPSGLDVGPCPFCAFYPMRQRYRCWGDTSRPDCYHQASQRPRARHARHHLSPIGQLRPNPLASPHTCRRHACTIPALRPCISRRSCPIHPAWQGYNAGTRRE
mmetsp:Transcript_111793/g.280018  ORF Transcript_111793/g.280018 Transcript_111793/m.280018 type:complete len:263 (-) Transcript_111793:600-1388(-)